MKPDILKMKGFYRIIWHTNMQFSV